MSRTVESIFRPFNPSDAERSDRSAGDRARHRLKVRESIRENIADIIAEESIIGKDRDKVIKVPIRGIREYKFVYGDNVPGVGQGTGESQNGQVVGKAKQGRAPQLPLEAAIAVGGGFAGLAERNVAGLRYISASGSRSARAIARSVSASGSTSGARRVSACGASSPPPACPASGTRSG